MRVTPSTEDYNELWESTPAGGRASVHTGTYQEFSGEANERATEYLQRIKDCLAGELSSVELRIFRQRATVDQKPGLKNAAGPD